MDVSITCPYFGSEYVLGVGDGKAPQRFWLVHLQSLTHMAAEMGLRLQYLSNLKEVHPLSLVKHLVYSWALSVGIQ